MKNKLFSKITNCVKKIINNKNIIISIFFLIFLFLVIYIIYIAYKKNKITIENYKNDNDFIEFIKNHTFFNEKDEKIDHQNNEIDEQYQAYKFIKPEDVVLELGGRYGSVSVVINKLVNDKNSHVVIEPDENVLSALEKNKELNNCNFSICPKFISNKSKKIIYDGYGTRIEDSDNNEINNNQQISYKEFTELYPQKFNVLVADCEGCLGEFLENMGNDFNDLTKVIYEEDQPHMCDYQKIKDKLINAGFVEKDKSFNQVFRYVYVKE
jgi:FkbM family methyltransferase